MIKKLYSFYNNHETIINLLLILFSMNFIYFTYWHKQPLLLKNNHQGWDGIYYYSMYSYFKDGIFTTAIHFPFHNRILEPWLASLLPSDNPIVSFRIINILSINVFIVVMYKVLKQYLSLSIFLISIFFFWLAFHWEGAVRLYIFAPYLIDVPVYLFEAILILIIFSKKYYFLPFIAPFATLQKESFIVFFVVLFAYMIISNYLSRKRIVFTGLPKFTNQAILFSLAAIFISILVKYYSNHYIIEPLLDGSGLKTMIHWMIIRLKDPYSFLRWFAAIFVGFSGILILAILDFKSIFFQKSHAINLIAIYTLLHIVLGLIAGSAMTRIIFIGYPFIMVTLLILIQQEKKYIIILSIFLSLPLLRILSKIAEPSVVSPADRFNMISGILSWQPEFTHIAYVNSLLLYGLFMYIILNFIKKLNA